MLKQAAIIALLGISSASFAGGWQLKLGGSVLAPTQDTTTPLGVVKADHEINFTPSVEYFFGDTPFSAELLLATPFDQEVTLNGTKVAKVKHLPPTITAKYNFKNSTRFTPYVGIGATALITWDESGVADKVKNDFGVAGQLGFNYQPADAKNWGVYFDVRYADLSPEVRLNVANNYTFDLDIDPIVYTIGYSYKF
ncbi:OmpW family outer membrane protein [Acinetobacter gerneri]|uniref:OmpW family outer membrane protein n=1 Tax=Acinetobacter gerneri TaxID=202952 RepID=A0AAW8JKH3_9GAMM|nr:OmpW family outer membrane protein [Acinetobacter gerneri]MDQ9011366.1 OmpW family outer membrane protein [Acinetobacter gerneri]MDQ9015502.1 OmpW family outer membrane protein [Acinetobacter gerneri]MDQ9026667.1 OmpW family outer membrane protein [Acinetobacter gerneri]MDQ9053948.1 OmpW family outer membrane protein [Acinetobacter gerneri]MDQ9061618.1 OmpW family outer membrane protein [Acinetobacter gerneri]